MKTNTDQITEAAVEAWMEANGVVPTEFGTEATTACAESLAIRGDSPTARMRIQRHVRAIERRILKEQGR